MRSSSAVLACAVLLVLPGCKKLDELICEHEAIRGTLRTALVSGEDAVDDTLAGNFESRRDENPELDAVEAAIEGRALSGRGVSMWLQRGLDHTLNLSLWLPTPLRRGDVLPVVATHADRPFWGTVENPTGGLSVGVRLDDFIVRSASGTARVVGLSPLRIDLDLVASDSARQVSINGTLNVRREAWTESCFE